VRGELLWGVVVSQRCCVAVGLSPVLRGGGVSGVGGGVSGVGMSGDNALVVRVVREAPVPSLSLLRGVCECTGVVSVAGAAGVGVMSEAVCHGGGEVLWCWGWHRWHRCCVSEES